MALFGFGRSFFDILFLGFYFCCILDSCYYFSLPLKPRDKSSNIFLLCYQGGLLFISSIILFFIFVGSFFCWIIFYLTHPIQWTRIKNIQHNYFIVFNWLYLAVHWLLYPLSFSWYCFSMRVLRLCNVLLSLVLYSLFFIGCNVVIKEVKRLVLRPLKIVVRESCVDFIILLPDYPVDSPLYSHLLHHSFYHEVGLFFTLLFTFVFPLFYNYYTPFYCSL